MDQLAVPIAIDISRAPADPLGKAKELLVVYYPYNIHYSFATAA